MENAAAVEELRAAMADAGLSTSDEIVGDGKLHRFDVDGDTRGRENGWYILHVDERPAGRFGSWKTGEAHSWTARVSRKLTGAERKALETRITEQKWTFEEEQARVHEDAAERAAELWGVAQPALRSHAYLMAKSIEGKGLRTSAEALLVPMRDGDGKLWNLQRIFPDGTKRFLAGGRVAGCYSAISAGKPDPRGVIAIVEGYATGVSVHAATDFPVVVAFNTGNLLPVARVIREKYPDARIVMCADDDRWKPPKNPGVEAASEAGLEIDALLAIPKFARPVEGQTDFNDLARAEGLPVVERQIREAVEAALTTEASNKENPPELYQGAVVPQDPQVEGHSAVAAPQRPDLPSGRSTFNGVGTPVATPAALDSDQLFNILSSIPSKHSMIAHELSENCAGRILFDELRAKFYVFNKVWRPTTDGDIQRQIQQVLDAKMPDGYRADTLNSTFKLFRLKVGRGKTNPIEWNAKGFVPVQNGLVDLATGKLAAFSKDLKLDWILPYAYDPEATCPTFDRLLEQLSGGDAESHRLLTIFLAAVIRCRSDLQKYLELVGLAGSGKSSYMHVAQMLVGSENVVSSNMRQLGANRFETAGFYGKRLAVFADEKDHVAEGTDVFKAITGGDRIRYEQKGHQQGENFRFDGLVIVSCNSPMTFEDYSGAIPRRRMTVHIDATIRDKDRDPQFFEKLSSEMPGVLNKLLAISDMEIEHVLLDRGGGRRDAAKRALTETNSVADWFNQCVVLADGHEAYAGSLRRENGKVEGADQLLYPNFVAWMESNGRRGTLSLRKFMATLQELVRAQELPVSRGGHTSRGIPWRGMKLRAEYDRQPMPITGQSVMLL